jgi:hypothetical protein
LHVICDSDSIVIKPGSSYHVIEWSTGSTEDSITVSTPGLYYAVLESNDLCRFTSLPIEVATDPDSIKPVLDFAGVTLKCHGETSLLSVSSGLAYTWSNGETTQTIDAGETGEYYALVHSYCRDQYSDTISLTFLYPEAPAVQNDTFGQGEPATLHAVGDSIVWYYDPNGVSVIGTGPELTLDGLTDTAVVYAANLNAIPGFDFPCWSPDPTRQYKVQCQFCEWWIVV